MDISRRPARTTTENAVVVVKHEQSGTGNPMESPFEVVGDGAVRYVETVIRKEVQSRVTEWEDGEEQFRTGKRME